MFGKNLGLMVLVVCVCLTGLAVANEPVDLDPNLVGWWRFEEGGGTRAIDESGHDFHGTLMGDPAWAPGYEGLALDLDGVDDYVETGKYPSELGIAGDAPRTVSMWVYTRSFNGGGLYEMGGDGFGDGFWLATSTTDNSWVWGWFTVDSLNEWTHLAHVHGNGYGHLVYANGRRVARQWRYPMDVTDDGSFRLGVHQEAYFDGLIDDVRIYDVVVPGDQIPQLMRGGLSLAWNPQPEFRAVVNLEEAQVLHWSGGIDAVAHDVYLGADRDAVREATVTTAGVYQGRQPAQVVTYRFPGDEPQWGATYYWRIDEIDSSGAIHRGSLWSFTTRDFLLIDDFESYDYDYEAGTAIWQTWLDGIDDPNNQGNSIVDQSMAPFFPPPTIVHSGERAMALGYDNTIEPWYSQVTRTWDVPQDWTRYGVDTLTLYLQGGPPTFRQRSDGTIRMTGWRNHDEDERDSLRYGYKELTGDGVFISRVDKLDDTNTEAKAGVMIRDGTGAGATNVYAFVTADNRIGLQYRVDVNGPTETTVFARPDSPRWLRLQRQGDLFLAQCSSDGVDWLGITDDPNDSSVHVSMWPVVFVGLAIVDAGTDYAAVVKFSGIQTEGGVHGDWTEESIGGVRWDWWSDNEPERLYIQIGDKAGNLATINHPDPEVTWTANWQPWRIPVSELATAGVNVTDVHSITIGTRDGQTPAPGTGGWMHFDDIQLTSSKTVDPNTLN